MNFAHIKALVLRHTLLYYKGSVPRIVELFFWPTMDLLTWGFVTTYLLRQSGAAPSMVTFLLGAMIFWDVIYRAQQSVSISYLEDVWSRNLLNVFVAPVKLSEFVAATYIIGLLKVFVVITMMIVMAICFYSFNLMSIGLTLIPFFTNLLFFGWSLGLIANALLMRWGQAAEALAWAVPFAVQPLSAVFYPVSILPGWLQPVALMIPSTHVFEGMRQVLRGQGFSMEHFFWALLLNILFMAAASLLFNKMFHEARVSGRLTKMFT